MLLILLALVLAACNDDAPAADSMPAGESAGAAVETPSRIPAEIARLPLVEGQTVLRDFRLDATNGVAYVTDSAYRLHVVSLEPLEEIATYETSGDLLTLDAANGRLYIAPYDPLPNRDAAVTVFDTANRAVLWSVLGSRVGVDSTRNRYYVGDVAEIGPRAVGDDMPLLGVRLYNGETQQLLAQGSVGGTPLYNPARDEVIVYGHSAQTLDPESLSVRTDLFPEITAESLPGCTGCRYVRNVWLLEQRGTMAFDIAILSGGAGGGPETGPLLYDSVTMTPSDDRRSLSLTCSSQPLLIDAVGGGFLHHDWYSRYEAYNNLTVRGLQGETLVFKDGLGAPFVNPATGAAYLATPSGGSWVVDTRTLAPLGVSAAFCPLARGTGDTFFATDGERKSLLLMAGTGGSTLLPASEPLAGGSLESRAIRQILLSPDFGRDATIFLVVTPNTTGGDQVLRSTDAGASWTVIGGIPTGVDLTLALAISPDYANDKTLFLGGYRSTYAGEGVWKSVDGADTWTPLWEGLSHLRVFQIRVSPTYATDGLVHAFSQFVRIAPWEQGASVSRWDPRVGAWDTTPFDPATWEPSIWLPLPQGSELPVRKVGYAEPIEVQDANGEWHSAGEWGRNQTLRDLLASPRYAEDGTIYVVTDLAVFRTTDRGATWQQLQDERLVGLTWNHLLTSAALSPVLNDDTYRILIGTQAGEIWQEDPATLRWVEADAELSQGTTLPTPDGTPAPVATATLAGAAATSTPVISTSVDSTPVISTPAGSTPTTDHRPPATEATDTPSPLVPSPLTPVPPTGLWGSRWAASTELQQALGLALSAEPAGIPAAYQFFEKGTMVWRSDTGMIYAILNDGTWKAYPDTFVEGEMERDPNIYTPGELLQPERGFGKVWREHEELLEAIGWARAEEQGVTAQVQEFERGFAMRLSGLEFMLLDNGLWKN